MAIRDPPFRAVDPQEVKGTVWGSRLADPRDQGRPTHQNSFVDIISLDQQNLAATKSLDVEVKGDWRVQAITFDFAPDVDARVFINGVERFKAKDRLGLSGEFRLGDLAGGSFMRVQSVRIIAENVNSTQSRDARAWMVVG